MSVSVVVPHAAQTLAEGPHWEPESKSLLYVDMGAGDVHKFNTHSGEDEKIHFDRKTSFLIPRRNGGYVMGLRNTIVAIDWESEEVVQVLYEAEFDENSPSRFNDAKCDKSGRLWAGTMGDELKPGQGPDKAIGALYSMDSKHVTQQHLNKMHISNGLAWSADNTRMFYIDSGPRQIYSFNFDINIGKLSDQQVLLDMSDRPIAELGFPDGMCIDNDGKLWVACYAASKVIQVDPETGMIMQSVRLPGAARITSCCFGGADYDELYVTSAKDGVSEAEFQSTQTNAGSIFKVTGLGSKGSPIPMYDG